MFRFALSLLAIIGSNAAIALESPGTEAAFGVCDSFNFDSSKENCQRVVRNKFFDTKAVRICTGMNFESEKMECLSAVAGREFTSETELSMCGKKNFASDKLS